MKKFTLFILLFFLFSICNSQQAYFNKTVFPYSGSNNLWSIVEMDSTYYVLSGNVDTPYTWFQTNCILNVNKAGNIINKKAWWDSSYAYAKAPNNSLIKTSDNHLVYVGYIKDTLSNKDGYLVKLNKNFDTLWTRTFTHPDTFAASQVGADIYNSFTAIRETWDKGYIISGNYNKDCIAGNIRSYLLKTDSLGYIEWIKTYPNVQYIFDIEIVNDSGFVFTDFQNGFHINKTNTLGDIIWRKIPNSETHLVSGSVEVLSDGNYVIMAPYVYYNPFPNFYQYAVNIIKYDSSGQIIWDKKYKLFQSFECVPLGQYSNLAILSDKSIMVSGTSIVINPLDTNESGHKGVLMKLNQNGDSLWARYYGYGEFEDDCQFNDIVLTDDGGFLGVGWHKHYQTGITWQDAWLVKLDSMGCDTPGCHTVGINISTPLNVRNVIIYPNPASNEITIDFGETLEQDGFVEIYNITGMLVSRRTRFTSNENSNKVKIDVRHLKIGLYLGKIIFNTGEVGNFKFIVE